MMSTVKNNLRRFVREEEGASLAEYALLLGVITVALITVITSFRNSISNIFSKTTNTLNSAGS
jgi:pilus assembly protein Flp/PilA